MFDKFKSLQLSKLPKLYAQASTLLQATLQRRGIRSQICSIVGRSGTYGLCTFRSPYRRSGCEPTGVKRSSRASLINFLYFNSFNNFVILTSSCGVLPFSS
ncbi:unnamed protein product, partial [Dicrocoelium dendriticum]